MLLFYIYKYTCIYIYMLPLTEAEESKELDELEQCTEVNKVTFNRDKYEVLSSSPHC